MTSNLRWCADCEKHHWKAEKCYPVFEVVPLDHGYDREDARKVRAQDAEHAAERFALEWDSDGDYNILNGSPLDVEVYEEGSEIAIRFSVTGEAVPEYRAKQTGARDTSVELGAERVRDASEAAE